MKKHEKLEHSLLDAQLRNRLTFGLIQQLAMFGHEPSFMLQLMLTCTFRLGIFKTDNLDAESPGFRDSFF